MVGAVPPVTPAPSASVAQSSAPPAVPSPRRAPAPSALIRQWYENELGWATVPGEPVLLSAGLRFDVLDVPAEAGLAALRHLGSGSPVAVCADRIWLLVAAGSAEELPGVLDWLEWGTLAPDVVPIGAGGVIPAPAPPRHRAGAPGRTAEPPPPRAAAGGHWRTAGNRARPNASQEDATGHRPHGPVPLPGTLQGAAWLRPPVPGCEVETSLPTLSALGGVRDAPDLVRVVDTVATWCHRIRLRRAGAQPLAFS
ncbi:SCO3374 family protein [Streptomyces sp. enrichment culture]|uniref:SCO3374 family protein n=1 Tax=Streptomyces sp. enrichment culture TaxID=1795815 RepID=UPI003F54D184